MANGKDPIETAVESAKQAGGGASGPMTVDTARKKGLELVEKSGIAYLGSIGKDGAPSIKAFMKAETEGLKTVWFSTNTSSRRVADLRRNPRCCVYFCDETRFKGLMLSGTATVRTDAEARKRLWRDGCEIYYPKGVDNPDYSVIEFTAETANYYEGLSNLTFPAK